MEHASERAAAERAQRTASAAAAGEHIARCLRSTACGQQSGEMTSVVQAHP